jgi:two-component system response regulator HydG
MSQYRLLIVHPDASVRTLLGSMLQALGHHIEEACNDRVAVRLLDQAPVHLVIAGVEPDDPDALELLSYARRRYPGLPVVLLFPNLQTEKVREALQWGAASVLRFPVSATHLRAAVTQALGVTSGDVPVRPSASGSSDPHLVPVGPAAAHAAAASGAAPPPARDADGDGLVGRDGHLRATVELAASIAPTRAPVLVVGERGTGKTQLARLLHRRSSRQSGPFVEFDCSSLREHQLEAELFGRAGFGTHDERPGKLAQARGGTLLIKQVNALPPDLQSKLLRVIQDGTYEPVGSTQSLRADARLVLAAREDLAPLVDRGLFRQDLYYRISVVTLNLPPLRHRGDDIVRLAEHFRERYGRDIGRPVSAFAPEALELLRAHPWPDNVRELESVVERAVVLCRGPRIEREQLEFARRDPRPAQVTTPPRRNPRPAAAAILPLKEALEEPEKQLILQALEALNWNRQETARVLDINRTTLYKKMKKYGLLYDEPVWVN